MIEEEQLPQHASASTLKRVRTVVIQSEDEPDPESNVELNAGEVIDIPDGPDLDKSVEIAEDHEEPPRYSNTGGRLRAKTVSSRLQNVQTGEEADGRDVEPLLHDGVIKVRGVLVQLCDIH